ncbi:hypothetical protein [Halosolutus gelatinilyticus]|uniref:hypothetical protein n=1 Tax=Halosolutus gelatinilyticus TaxID=2931975 RepID=UPI001FF18966|nr:hypothetical protein [Halosolutus gelatinilyticus]
MDNHDPSEGPPGEIEVSLDDGAELELCAIEVDSDGLPLEFSIDGVIRELDPGALDRLRGMDIEPIAVRFRLRSREE